VGGQLAQEYLRGFGIPQGVVQISAVSKLMIAAVPTMISVAAVLALSSLVGWMRYFYLLNEVFLPILLSIVACGIAIYLVASLALGQRSADRASERAVASALSGQDPREYDGITSSLVCLKPVVTPVPVDNGPLVTNEPVLSFGENAAGRLWVWYPGETGSHAANSRAFSVPVQDVQVVQAAGRPARC
jgi:hypothetical protein